VLREILSPDVYIRVLIAFVGLGIVAGAVTLLLKHLLWRRLAEMHPEDRDVLRSEESEIAEFWADRPRVGERHDWTWRIYRAGWAIMSILYPPIATIWIRTGTLSMQSEVTVVEILAMIGGGVSYVVLSRWRLKHYRCKRCGSATVRLEGETPRFSCARCGVIWNLGNV